ncbi:MAG: penicillin-binding protein 2 [Acidothermus cellulolyticus]|nr:penicillin-binding protein 2 [Acidothermus cellulolyticus]
MENRSRIRLVVLAALVLSLPVTLISRLWYLQVMAGGQYAAAANRTSTNTVHTVAPRGLVVDDVGRVLAGNESALVVSALATALPKDMATRRAELQRLAAILGVSEQDLEARVTLCDYHRYGAKAPQMNPGCWTGSPLQPIPLLRLDTADAAARATQIALQVLERQELFPGITAEIQQIRNYPSPAGASAAQILGHVGKITADDVARAKTQQAADELKTAAAAGEMIGQAGLEAEYDQYLRGTMGTTVVSVDPAGNPLGTVREIPPTPGATLVTSIDARVQQIAEQALADAVEHARTVPQLANHRMVTQHADAAAAVVIDARTGHVLALANYPTYNPGVWDGGSISQTAYDALLHAPGNPLFSQAVQGEYAPGSTFKPITTAGAVSTPYYSITGRYDCPTVFTAGNRTFTNFEGETGLGAISFAEALTVSCDTFFYKIGDTLWKADGGLTPTHPRDAIINEALGWGLGQPTHIDLPIDGSGNVETRQEKIDAWKKNKALWCAEAQTEPNPLYREYDRENCQDGYQYREGDALNFAIGQGTVTVTPLQLAMDYAAIGNGGTLFTPRIGRALVAPNGTVIQEINAPSRKLPAPADVLSYLRQALTQVTTNPLGTAYNAFAGFPFDKYTIGGKTGTAEVQALNPDGTPKDSTAWFASFGGPVGQPAQYAVVVMVSQGGQGGVTAAPAVREIYDGLYGLDGSGPYRLPHDAFAQAGPALPGGVPPATLPNVATSGVPTPTAAAANASGVISRFGTGTAAAVAPAVVALPPERRGGRR